MIKDTPFYSKSGALSRYIPSKETVKEYIFLIISGLLFARVDFMGVINIFGFAWMTVLFLQRRNTVLGMLGIIAGRLTVLSTLSTDGLMILSELSVYVGAYLLLAAIKKIYSGNAERGYIIASILFYVVAETALTVIYDVTVFNIIYVFLNAVCIGTAIYLFSKALEVKDGIDFRNISRLNVLLLVGAVLLAIMGVGRLVVFTIDIRMIIIYATVLITAYSYGAGTGALVGTVFGILLGVEGHYSLMNIVPFTVCGVICGILSNTAKIASASVTALVYTALFFLLEYGMAELHSFAELFIGMIIYVLFPSDILGTVRDALQHRNSPITSARSYADRVQMTCCEKIDGVCRSTDKMHRILKMYLCDTEKVNMEQFNQLTEKIKETVCTHCTMCSKCSFVNNTGKRPPACEVARIVNDINRVGTNWRSKMTLYREVPAIAVGCVSDSVRDIKKKLESTVRVNNNLSLEAEQQCKGVCKYVDGVAVLNGENGYEVIIRLKTVTVTHEDINRLKTRCEDVTNVKLELSSGSNGIIIFSEKAKYMLSTGIVSVPFDRDGICGDSSTVIPFGNNGFMIAVADGCGTGYPALRQSSMAMELLETMAQSGCDEDATVSLINTLMALRMDDDRYSTADICVFNKYTGSAKFIKMGAVCSFIVHKGNVTTVNCGASPLGINGNSSDCVENYKLRSGDAIIMMTDGVYDACGGYHDPNEYFTDILSNMKMFTAQQVAQSVMDNVFNNIKKPKDDMLVFVAMVK